MNRVMPFYLCIDTTEHCDAMASACRQMQGELAQACVEQDVGGTAQLGIIGCGESATQITPLNSIEYQASIPDFETSKPLRLSRLYELMGPLLQHDVAHYKSNGATVLRPVVALLMSGPAEDQHDLRGFQHLVTQAPINPLVISLGVGDAAESVVAAHQTVGGWMAEPAPVEDQIHALLSTFLAPMIIGSAHRVTAGEPAVTFPTAVSNTRRIA